MANLQKSPQSQATSRPTLAKSATTVQVSATPQFPTAEAIAARAYEIWQERGCPEGCEQENWYQAEHELLQRASN